MLWRKLNVQSNSPPFVPIVSSSVVWGVSEKALHYKTIFLKFTTKFFILNDLNNLFQLNIDQYQIYTLIIGHKTVFYIYEQLSPNKL